METNVLLRLIKEDIKLLEEISGSFNPEENLSFEEVEVALARARSLVAEMEMLSRVTVREPETAIRPESDSKELPEEKIPVMTEAVNMSELDTELIDLELDEVVQLETMEQIEEPKAEEAVQEVKAVMKEKAEKAAKSARPESTLVQGELFDEAEQNHTKTLGETIGEKRQMIHDFLATERSEIGFEEIPLKSMHEGIGINDRYLFIRELFGSEAEKFDRTITALDGFTEIEEAVGYLKQHFKWSKSEAAQKFLNLVKRRYRK